MKTLGAIGRQGSWFADVEGERLPCVHSHWTTTIENPEIYRDPGPKEGARWAELIDALKIGGRAVLTNSHPSEPGGQTFKRYGYMALYEVSDVSVDASALCFNFGRKVANVVRRGNGDRIILGDDIPELIPKKSDVYEAIDRFERGVLPLQFRDAVSWFIVDDRSGKSYPLKGIWSLATNTPSALFNTSDAISGAKRLGFRFSDGEIDRDVHEADAVSDVMESEIPETSKKQLIDARVGQGLFRNRVAAVERRCRITGVKDDRLLRASHILPWRLADNRQRLDGNNGLFLTPLFDHLFDRGFMSFFDDGRHVFSPAIPRKELRLLGLDKGFQPDVRPFSHAQKFYLDCHRQMHGVEHW